MANLFTVVIHHGGHFENTLGGTEYVGGETTHWDNCDYEKWSTFEIWDKLAKMGYMKKNYDILYSDPRKSLDDSLNPIVDDKQSIPMARVGVKVGEVYLYVLHAVEEFNEVLLMPWIEEVVNEGGGIDNGGSRE